MGWGLHASGWRAWLPPMVVWLAFFMLYAMTAAPSIAALFDDSLEFQLVLPTFGIAHPTGYPLYTLLGGIWSNVLFPFGNWAWRTNVFSALTAATAVLLVFLLARRLVTHKDGSPDVWAGLASATLFGLGPVWWAQATLAEVYALHNLLVAAILLTAVGIDRTEGARFDRRMALLCLLLGLGLAHHRTIVLLLPGLAIYLFWSVPGLWRPRRAWLLWAAALTLPLLLYLYLPVRAGMGVRDLHGSYTIAWSGFWDHVLARGYTGFFGATPLAPNRSWADWLRLWVDQMGWVGAILAVLGLSSLFDDRLRPVKAWVLIGVVLVTNLAFALLYRVGDQEVFLLPVFLCSALFAGGGLGVIERAIPQQRWATTAGAIGVILLLAGFGRGAAIDRSDDWTIHDYAVDMAKVDFPPDSRVIGLEGEMTALKYMQQAEGLGTNAVPVVADDPEARRAALAATIAAGQPAYLTRELEGSAGAYSFSGEGPLVRVWPRGAAQPGQPQHPQPVAMNGGRLQLEGYDVERLAWAGGPVVRLALYWRPLTELTETLKVSLRVLGPDGAPLTQPDGSPAAVDSLPLRQVAPTTTWLPGEVVRDVHEIHLPPAVADQPAKLLLILYDAETLVEEGRVEIEAPG